MKRPKVTLWDTAVLRQLDGVPRPGDSPQAHAPGYDSDRVLILGAGPASGWGVATHDLALPGALARAMSARTGRGSVVDVVESTRMTVADATERLERIDLTRYDAVILVLGITEALSLSSRQSWRAGLEGLLGLVIGRASRYAQVLVTGIQPVGNLPLLRPATARLASTRIAALNIETAQICAATDRAIYVPLTQLPARADQDRRYRTPADYGYWAELLAAPLVPLLDGPGRVDSERRSQDAAETGSGTGSGEDRADLLDRLILDVDEAVEGPGRLGSIVKLARQVFDTESAFVALLDDGGRWVVMGSDSRDDAPPVCEVLCGLTLASRDELVVRDAWDDERTQSAAGALGVETRFFAGFPLEFGGERVGVLGVADSLPRRRRQDEVDVVFLRELAMLAQRDLDRTLR